MPVKPELLVLPVIVRDPSVTPTAPTFRTTIVICGVTGAVVLHVPTHGTNVAISIEMLDCAAWFCAPCCPPVALDVWLRNP